MMFFLLCLLLLSSSVQSFTSQPTMARLMPTTLLHAEEQADAATTTTENDKPAAELPSTYVRCGKCQTSYPFTVADLGGRNARRLECSLCGHSWFQSKERIMDVQDNFEIVPLPQRDLERIKLNKEEGRPPSYYGEKKLYVGNISFECTEDDIYELFENVGMVGDVSLVRDDEGRARGFGFVTMRTAEEAEKAVDTLDGSAVKGRDIAVRPSNT